MKNLEWKRSRQNNQNSIVSYSKEVSKNVYEKWTFVVFANPFGDGYKVRKIAELINVVKKESETLDNVVSRTIFDTDAEAKEAVEALLEMELQKLEEVDPEDVEPIIFCNPQNRFQ